jgi:hypothetical protein
VPKSQDWVVWINGGFRFANPSNRLCPVTLAKAGIQRFLSEALGPRLRGDDNLQRAN